MLGGGGAGESVGGGVGASVGGGGGGAAVPGAGTVSMSECSGNCTVPTTRPCTYQSAPQATP